MKNIEEILAPFDLSFGRKQDLGNLLLHLKDNGVSCEEVLEYITELKKKSIEEQLLREKNSKKMVVKLCPLCSKPMRLLPVNVGPGTAVRGGWRSVYLCQNQECMHTIYNKESVEEITKRGGK